MPHSGRPRSGSAGGWAQSSCEAFVTHPTCRRWVSTPETLAEYPMDGDGDMMRSTVTRIMPPFQRVASRHRYVLSPACSV